jgi:plasmid stability protein
MANLQIKGIEDELYRELKIMAAEENRSVSQQALFLVKEYLARKKQLRALKTPAQILLDLSSSWQDHQDSAKMIAQIKKARRNSQKLVEGIQCSSSPFLFFIRSPYLPIFLFAPCLLLFSLCLDFT